LLALLNWPEKLFEHALKHMTTKVHLAFAISLIADALFSVFFPFFVVLLLLFCSARLGNSACLDLFDLQFGNAGLSCFLYWLKILLLLNVRFVMMA